jgi:tripartite-type tricarboxylate transporter receptor subunit TctC
MRFGNSESGERPMKNRPTALRCACIGLLLGCAQSPASAQTPAYPTKPIRFVVPFPPGGGNDTIARLIGQRLAASLGQQVVIDNRAGAGGVIGAEAVARSPADGYTMLLAGVATFGIGPNLRRKIPYDPVRDFDAVSLIASAPLLVVVHPSLPVKSVKELIAFAKARPGQINYASNGVGASSHLAVELFNIMTGTRLVHIPYKGLSQALTDVLAGQVPVMFSSAVAMLPHVKSGKVRAIAMTGDRRSPAIPAIPTVIEAGVPGYETGSWYGVVVPAGTPKAAVSRLAQEIVAITKSPEITARLVDEAVIPVASSPEAFAAHIRSELARWAKVIRAANIEPE